MVLTRDCVLVTVTLTDANQEGAIFVLGSQQQLLSFHTVYVPIVPPEQRRHGHRQGGEGKKAGLADDQRVCVTKQLIKGQKRKTVKQTQLHLKANMQKPNANQTLCACIYSIYHISHFAHYNYRVRKANITKTYSYTVLLTGLVSFRF